MKMKHIIEENNVYFIAEMSANHAGSLENALEIVRAAARAGADCVKVQTYTPDTMTLDCDNEYFRIHGGPWDGYTLYDLYREAATPYDWHARIMKEAHEHGLDFLSTPFDRSAVDFLRDLGVQAYKIASFELTDIPLVEYVAQQGKPIILSSGMATMREISRTLRAIRAQGNEQVVLLKCTSEYPARPADMNLATIPDMAERFGVRVGLSDHSMGSGAAVAAALLGARVIEKHFCLSRSIKNPDSVFSMEPEEYAQMVRDVRTALEMYGEARYGAAGGERENLQFRRSIFAVRDIVAGEQFSEQNIRVIRPSAGLPPEHYATILGTACKAGLRRGQPVREEDVCIQLNCGEN